MYSPSNEPGNRRRKLTRQSLDNSACPRRPRTARARRGRRATGRRVPRPSIRPPPGTGAPRQGGDILRGHHCRMLVSGRTDDDPIRVKPNVKVAGPGKSFCVPACKPFHGCRGVVKLPRFVVIRVPTNSRNTSSMTSNWPRSRSSRLENMCFPSRRPPSVASTSTRK
jgi:hypothetical protein